MSTPQAYCPLTNLAIYDLAKGEKYRIFDPSNRKVLLRVFEPAKSLKTIDNIDNIRDRIKASKKRLDKLRAIVEKNTQSIPTPKGTFSFTDAVGNRLEFNDLSVQYRNYGSTHSKLFLARNYYEAAFRLITRMHNIRWACIVNNKTPSDIMDWIKSFPLSDWKNKLEPLAKLTTLPDIGYVICLVQDPDFRQAPTKVIEYGEESQSGNGMLSNLRIVNRNITDIHKVWPEMHEWETAADVIYKDNGKSHIIYKCGNYSHGIILDSPNKIDGKVNLDIRGKITEVAVLESVVNLEDSPAPVHTLASILPPEFWKVDMSAISNKVAKYYIQ